MSLASKVEFATLCDVFEKISKAKCAKKNIFEEFIQKYRIKGHKLKTKSPDADISLYPLMRLILPKYERERGPHNLKEKTLANLYIRVLCLGKNSNDAKKLLHYKVPTKEKIVGQDFAEKAYCILRKRLSQTKSDLTVEQINKFLDDISSQSETNGPKDELFRSLLGKINPLEFKWITRIILKDLRFGIGTKKILEALHPHAHKRFEISTDLREICDTIYHGGESSHQGNIRIFSHFKPMLLERYHIENAKKLFDKGEEYFVQCKYDGERSQMHMKDGKFKYFTRNGFDITNNPSYGEDSSAGFMSSVFGRLLDPQCKSIILDGELMGWHKREKSFSSKGMSFDVKKLTVNSHHQPCFIAFDLILYNDRLLVNEPYEQRLEMLKDAFTEEEGSLMLSKSIKISNSDELREAFNESIRNKDEGIVLKECNSTYKPNVRDGNDCYKIKAEYSDDLVEDIDLIIVGGYYGDGKFMGLIKSFLMAVTSPPKVSGENPTQFFSVVSVSNGLSMEMLQQLKEIFEDKWLTECPSNVVPPRLDQPDKWVQPEKSIILTVRATEMSKSNDYPLGYSLRFPRVMNIRADKPWYTVCTTTELESLIKDNRPIQKLAKREVEFDDIEENPEPKLRRTKKYRSPISFRNEATTSSATDSSSVVHLSRLFDGKKICVINGDDELPKERIETILLQHRAKIMQSTSKEIYCIIVGNNKTVRASSIIQSKKYDVVKLDWFKRVIKEENWPLLQDFLPWDLYSARESTKQRLARYYDDYYDSYTVDADEESLLRSFKKIEEEGSAYELDCTQMKEIDKELFPDGISPYSIFRGMVGYFDDPSINISKYMFLYKAGTIKEILDDSVTHVFISKSKISPDLQNLIKDKSQDSLTVVKSEWIEKCFEQSAIVPNAAYLI